ncbi:hypothetical protein AVEN_261555-1 [Araneus ventricosus]|uniref:Uncharacterized protein n=1 Tax=Araneus ventricosus TaxID=182803 RepID=A0A4Y2JX01_ARAVE|nr:hypothetical protein AVEN_261555-1 [Araneus ventricosus]
MLTSTRPCVQRPLAHDEGISDPAMLCDSDSSFVYTPCIFVALGTIYPVLKFKKCRGMDTSYIFFSFLVSQQDDNRLGKSLGCKVEAVALTNQTYPQRFSSDDDNDDVQHEALLWMKQQPKEFYAARIGALIKRWDRCINNGGVYVEK